MPYLKDLTHYSLRNTPENFLCVGWLDSEYAFPTGVVDPVIAARISKLCDKPINLMRGYQYCSFCIAASRQRGCMPKIVAMPHGNGEIHVQGIGRVYVSPTLVAHYITEHAYLPPAEFLEAIRALDYSRVEQAS